MSSANDDSKLAELLNMYLSYDKQHSYPDERFLSELDGHIFRELSVVDDANVLQKLLLNEFFWIILPINVSEKIFEKLLKLAPENPENLSLYSNFLSLYYNTNEEERFEIERLREKADSLRQNSVSN